MENLSIISIHFLIRLCVKIVDKVEQKIDMLQRLRWSNKKSKIKRVKEFNDGNIFGSV